jgi:hypothetical protein
MVTDAENDLPFRTAEDAPVGPVIRAIECRLFSGRKCAARIFSLPRCMPRR